MEGGCKKYFHTVRYIQPPSFLEDKTGLTLEIGDNGITGESRNTT